MNEFLAMGGYAFYVWGAYGVTALALAVEAIAVAARARHARREARSATPDNLSAATQGSL